MSPQHVTKLTGAILENGALVELIYDREQKRTRLAYYAHGQWQEMERVARPGQPDLVPYAPQNALIENGIVRFPSRPEPYGDEARLVESIRAYIHRYVDVSEAFEHIAAYYVLFSWVYDAFNELPYLRVRGDYGTGKTRFLSIVGSIVYKPIFGSGASTVSPIFHLLEQFGGSLVIDEADFRFSDERADLVKILNNGNVRGFPVLRAMTNRNGEISPRAFRVYGPKIVASRGVYDDKALESRFITEDMGARSLRHDVPINLPKEHEAEAQSLRNKLLMYRFERQGSMAADADLVDRTLDGRLNQVFVPLLSVIADREVRATVVERAREHDRCRRSEREDSLEARVLTVLRHLSGQTSGAGVAVGDICALFIANYRADTPRPMTARRMGTIIRTRLGLMTHKSNGRFVVPLTDADKLARLYERFGVGDEDVAALTDPKVPTLVWERLSNRDLGT